MSLLADGVRGFLLDMDGTVYLGDQLLPGAERFLAFTRSQGIPVLFLSNNSSKNRASYVRKLTSLGLDVGAEQIFTSGDAAVLYLQTIAPPGTPIALFGTPDLEASFRQAGYELDHEQPQYVVLGFDMTIDYAKLTRLCDLVRAGLPYIATHPDINCPVEGGFIPDIGAMMAFVEASTGRQADIIIGKPNRPIIDMATARLRLPVESLCMVGDRLYTDVAMGHNAPIHTVLVLSGETQPDDIKDSPFQPDHVFKHLGALADHLQGT